MNIVFSDILPITCSVLVSIVPSPNFEDTATVLWECLEWSLTNADYAGNPYDLVATVTFTHQESGEQITTEMFFDGDNSWKFRFTGTKTGKWTFATSCSVPALDDHSGTITVNPNPDLNAHGFVTNFRSKWIWSGANEAFVPQLVMYKTPDKYYDKLQIIDEDIRVFLVEHGFNGFHTQVECRWFDINKPEQPGHSDDPNPDRRTFEALELLITRVHESGGYVHIWAWGKPNLNSVQTRWGVNGEVDKRLQRYIAARLGPIPGWGMSYGIDLNLWYQKGPYGGHDLNDGKALEEWHDYMQDHMGWKHFLGARWLDTRVPKPKKTIGHFSGVFEYSSYQRHRISYDEYVDCIDYLPDKPSFEEDRFRIRNSPPQFVAKDYNSDHTRRGLWHSTMAGGVANIWGNLVRDDGSDQPSEGGSRPYSIKEQIKTYSTFFFDKKRFRKDLTRNNTLTDYQCGVRIEGDSGDLNVCLASTSSKRYIFYKENATSIRMNLYGMLEPQPAVAVDTKKAYSEIDIGILNPENQTWDAPYQSDWAIAVGIFE